MTAAILLIASFRVRAQTLPADSSSSSTPFTLEQLLPSDVQQNTDINAWGWFSDLHDSLRDTHFYWETDVSLGVTQRFSDQLAGTADVHFIGEATTARGFLEQAFLTANVLPKSQTLLTFGKFNANFGIEPRNEWDRVAGTTSLLFGAQPQDLVGLQMFQPLFDDRLTVRPFIATQFQGHADFQGAPIGGIGLQYKASDSLNFNWTSLVGPGLLPNYDKYFYYYYQYYPLENWQGTRLHAYQGGMFLFSDANVSWTPTRDLTLAAEGLIAGNGASAGSLAWSGLMFLANYDITDRWRVFARYSYLNDQQWIVTGAYQTRQEGSGGVAYKLFSGVEIRGEYRHDFAPRQDIDSFSAHLTFSF